MPDAHVRGCGCAVSPSRSFRIGGWCANRFWRSDRQEGIRLVIPTRSDSSFKDDGIGGRTELDSVAPTQRLIVEQAYVMAQNSAAAESRPKEPGDCRRVVALKGNGRRLLEQGVGVDNPCPSRSSCGKGEPPESARVGRRDATMAMSTKTVMTALGAIVLWQKFYFSDYSCLGRGYVRPCPCIKGFLEREATRLFDCLALTFAVQHEHLLA